MSGLNSRVDTITDVMVRRGARLEYQVDVLNDLVELRVEDESDLHLAVARECLGGWIEALTEARDRLEVAVRGADAREHNSEIGDPAT